MYNKRYHSKSINHAQIFPIIKKASTLLDIETGRGPGKHPRLGGSSMT